jgi:hypothetical protein
MKEKTMKLSFKKTVKTMNKSLKNKENIERGGYYQDNPVRLFVLITRVWDKTGRVFFIANLQFIKGVK